MAEYLEKEAFKLWAKHFLTNSSTLLDVIDRTTPADVEPVIHGRWIGIYEWAKMHDSRPSGMCTYFWCSECQTAQEKKSNFCPNCGAKMDEDTKC